MSLAIGSGTNVAASPVSMGRRVTARAIDFVINVMILVVLNVATVSAMVAGGGGVEIVLVLLALAGAWFAFSFWALFARAALPGQLMLGLHHVDSSTGRRAGGKTFLKYLVQGFTFGLSVVITPLTIQVPNRSWFDRMAGVTLVDTRARTAAPTPSAQVAAPPAGWQVEESQLTQVGLLPAGPVPSGGMIESVPFDHRASGLASGAAPAVDRPVAAPVPQPTQPVVAPPPSVVPTAAPASPAVVAPVVVLDDGRRLTVDGTLVLGRAPRHSATLGASELVSLEDQSVSANHLAIGLDPTGPWVMDLRSTNGSWLEQDGAPGSRLEPMQRTAVSHGAVVTVGKRRMTVTCS